MSNIGDHVKQDELLAELAVPELDEQIAQNEATLDQLKAGSTASASQRDVGSGDLGPR